MSIEEEIRKLLGESKGESQVEELVEEIEEIEDEQAGDTIDESIEKALDELIEHILTVEDATAGRDHMFDYIKRTSLSQKKPGTLKRMIDKLKSLGKTKKLKEGLIPMVESIVAEIEGEKATEEVKKEEIIVDIQEDVDALLNGEELSEEFKVKAATIFEAAVKSRVKFEYAKLEEKFELRIQEESEDIKEGIIDKLDGYLNTIVEQWKKDNEIALVSGIKQEMFESFMVGIKNVFEENHVDIPEEKFDVIGSLEARLIELESKLEESVKEKNDIEGKFFDVKKAMIVAESTEGLTSVQEEKFISLAEELTFEDEESFKTKLLTIRENYFKKGSKPVIETFITEEPIEETVSEEEVSGPMSVYVKSLNKR